MADSNGYVQSVIDGSYEFYKKSLKQFSWYKKIYGTKCQVQRVKEDSKYSEVLGTMYSNNLKNSTEVEKFNYVVIINMNRMVKVYNESSDTIDFYDNESILKLGDVLVFTRRGREFRFKITDIMTFSEVGGLLNQYTMTPYIVVDTKESGAALERPGENAFVVTQDQLQNKTVVLGSELPEEVKPDLGFTALSEVKLDVDSDVINPDNIRTGVEILGVSGEFDGRYNKAIELNVTKNGEYLPEDYDVDAFSKVDVEVQPNLEELTITANGEYTPQDGADGFSKVVANVVPTRIKVSAININQGCLDENAGWDGTLIDASNINSLASFCEACRTAKYINISGWDLTNNTSFRNAFVGLGRDTNEGTILLGLDDINTPKITDLYSLFNNAKIRNSLDLSNWDTSNVRYYNYIMNGLSCPYVNIGGWKISHPTSSVILFYRANIPKINAAYTTFEGNSLRTMVAANTETMVGDYTIDDVINHNICVFEGLSESSYINTYERNSVLNRASLRAVINGLADLTGQTTQTLTLGPTLIAKLTEEDIAIATAKNWTIA